MSIFVKQHIAVERRKICNSCPSLDQVIVPTCKECGCLLAAKVRLSDAECPLKKWLSHP